MSCPPRAVSARLREAMRSRMSSGPVCVGPPARFVAQASLVTLIGDAAGGVGRR